MPVTSVRLPDALKQAVEELAAAEGRTAHAFMIEAIEEKLEAARLRHAFIAEAREALAEIEGGGEVVGHETVHAWMRERATAIAARIDPSAARPPRRRRPTGSA